MDGAAAAAATAAHPIHLVHGIVHGSVLATEGLSTTPHSHERDHCNRDKIDADGHGDEKMEGALGVLLVRWQVDLNERGQRESRHDCRLGAHSREVGVEELELLLAELDGALLDIRLQEELIGGLKSARADERQGRSARGAGQGTARCGGEAVCGAAPASRRRRSRGARPRPAGGYMHFTQ